PVAVRGTARWFAASKRCSLRCRFWEARCWGWIRRRRKPWLLPCWRGHIRREYPRMRRLQPALPVRGCSEASLPQVPYDPGGSDVFTALTMARACLRRRSLLTVAAVAGLPACAPQRSPDLPAPMQLFSEVRVKLAVSVPSPEY